jgi:hypothetical protein
MNEVVRTLAAGIGATLLVDAWALVRRAVFGLPVPDYGLVGRWLAHMRYGRFRHDAIAAAPRVAGERVLGWTAHYVIGMSFAALLPAIWGVAWLHDPTPLPALLVGIATVAAPLLVMQPGMGLGVAASRTPRPSMARLQSTITHAIFGLGLYATAWAIARV